MVSGQFKMRNLLVIPSIDIQDGKTVRVVQGIPDLECSEYGNDPVEMAMIWRSENAKCIHVVDFNAAMEDSKNNLELIEKICSSVVIPVELGGGIRSFEAAQKAFDAGVYRIIIGSLAISNQSEFEKIINKFGPQKVAAAIDVVNGKVVIKGRTSKTNITPEELADRAVKMGVERLIVTDVERNGMMSGPNVELSKNIGLRTGVKITLSGGVRDKDDLFKVKDEMDSGIDSVIVGRALYENKFPCQRLWRVAENGIFT